MFHLLVLICLCLGQMVGVFADSDVVMSVMEGDSVTLDSGVAGLKKEDVLKWMFGNENKTPIAQKKWSGNFSTSDVYVEFRDRLKLDHQTGSLTIMNTTTVHSGFYQPVISGQKKTKYSLNVYAHLPVPVITSKSSNSCLVVCSVVNVRAVTLSWYKGKRHQSRISTSNVSNSLSLDLKCLDDSYSCVVNISTTNQTTHLKTELCQPCPATTAPGPKSFSQSASQTTLSSKESLLKTTPTPQTPHIILISAGAVAVSLLTLAIVGIIWICRNPKKTDQKEQGQKQSRDDQRDAEVTYANPTFYKKHAQKSEDEVVYAGIVTRR